MVKSNFHTHTTYCDGENTPAEMADAAIALGFHSLGFSGHAYVPFEGLFHGMTPEAEALYKREIGELKERYNGRLDIYLGIENDSVNMMPLGEYDYSIGSVHTIIRDGKHFGVDSDAEDVARVIADEFAGDGLRFAVAYFDAVKEFASVKHADILGHIDLVRRFNVRRNGLYRNLLERNLPDTAVRYRFFDENDERYKDAARAAMLAAIQSGYIIEVSTAPLSKGFSNEPYPAYWLLTYAASHGANVIVSSDSHSVKTINYAFLETESLLRHMGFRHRMELVPDGFRQVAI